MLENWGGGRKIFFYQPTQKIPKKVGVFTVIFFRNFYQHF